MGWDIVAVGTNHRLNIGNPRSVAEALVQLCPGPLSAGFFDVDFNWEELFRITNNAAGIVTKMEIKELSDPDPFDLYELYNEINRPDNRVLNEIVEFSVDYPGRWSQFSNAFYQRYAGLNQKFIDEFRAYIYRQMQICGCDKAYYFCDQGPGAWLYDRIDRPAEDWLDFLYGKWRSYAKEYWEGRGATTDIRNVSDYLAGNLVKPQIEVVDCWIDDFSDLKNKNELTAVKSRR